VVKLLSGCSSLLFQKMTSLPKKGSRRQSSSPSVCRSQKERKKERKKKSDPSIQKFFVRTVFFSVVLKIIHYLFKSHKKNSVFERNIKFNTVVDKGERSAGDEDDDEDEDEEKARDVFLEKRRRTPRGDTTPTRIRRRLVDSWERKRATTTTR